MADRTIFTISKVIRAPKPPPLPKPTALVRFWRWTATVIGRVWLYTAEHLLNLMAIGALLIVLSHATFTTSHAWLARYSGVVSDLCLALLAAWVFNLIVVDLPRRRDRERIYTGIAWMVGLMAHSGISMMEFLSHPANVSVSVDPRVGGIVIAADRDVTERICAAIGPDTPYIPLPEAYGCWKLIRNHTETARAYHRQLQPWLPYFDATVIAAMNDVVLSELSMLCEEHVQIANDTLENLSETIYGHWKACDDLKAVQYAKVQPYMRGWRASLSRRERRGFTPQKHNERALAQALKAATGVRAERL